MRKLRSSLSSTFFILIVIAYRLSDRHSKEISKYLITMLFTLAFFRIVVDLLHVVVKDSLLGTFFVLLEDGGEQIAMSIIACFVFLMPERLQSDRNRLKIKSKFPERALSKTLSQKGKFAKSCTCLMRLKFILDEHR